MRACNEMHPGRTIPVYGVPAIYSKLVSASNIVHIQMIPRLGSLPRAGEVNP